MTSHGESSAILCPKTCVSGGANQRLQKPHFFALDTKLFNQVVLWQGSGQVEQLNTHEDAVSVYVDIYRGANFDGLRNRFAGATKVGKPKLSIQFEFHFSYLSFQATVMIIALAPTKYLPFTNTLKVCPSRSDLSTTVVPGCPGRMTSGAARANSTSSIEIHRSFIRSSACFEKKIRMANRVRLLPGLETSDSISVHKFTGLNRLNLLGCQRVWRPGEFA